MALIDVYEFFIRLSVVQWFGVLFICFIIFCVGLVFVNAIFSHFLGNYFRRLIDLRKNGQWAVITGATNDFGRSYAEKFASMGINIVLICTDLDKLPPISESLKQKFNVDVKIIAVDFTDDIKIYDYLRNELKGLKTEILINNFSIPKNLDQDNLDDDFNSKGDKFVFDLMRGNCISFVMMMRIILPQMQQNKKGIVLNIFPPLPKIASMSNIHSAIEILIDRISEGLQYEYLQFGIVIQWVNPELQSFDISFWKPTQQVIPELKITCLKNQVNVPIAYKCLNFIVAFFTDRPCIVRFITLSIVTYYYKRLRYYHLLRKNKTN